MGDICLQRTCTITTAAGVFIAISGDKLTILPAEGAEPVIITGADYERLKAEIARHVSPAAIFGKPLRGIGGEDIYLGIRKRAEGL